MAHWNSQQQQQFYVNPNRQHNPQYDNWVNNEHSPATTSRSYSQVTVGVHSNNTHGQVNPGHTTTQMDLDSVQYNNEQGNHSDHCEIREDRTHMNNLQTALHRDERHTEFQQQSHEYRNENQQRSQQYTESPHRARENKGKQNHSHGKSHRYGMDSMLAQQNHSTTKDRDKKGQRNETHGKDMGNQWDKQHHHQPTVSPDVKTERADYSDQSMEEVVAKHRNKHRHCYSEVDYNEMVTKYRKRERELIEHSQCLQLKVKELEEKNHEKEADLNLALGYIKDQKKESDNLSTRLAAEMSDKVSTNESSIENVSIRNRPTKVAEEYTKFCTETWLSAKQTLDEKYDEKYEKGKLNFLCQILMISEEKASEMHNLSEHRIQNILMNPLGAKSDPRQSMEAEDIHQLQIDTKNLHRASMNQTVRIKSDNTGLFRSKVDRAVDIPVSVHNTIGDYLRLCADDTNLDPLKQSVTTAIEATKYKQILEDLKHKPTIIEYVDRCVRICWKMVNQRPRMKFTIPNDGKQPNLDMEDIHWGSTSPTDPRSVVVCYVYPLMYHDKKIMAKGKVYVQHKM